MVSNFFKTIKGEEGFLALNNRDWVDIKKHLIILGFSVAASIFLIKFQMKMMKNLTPTSNSQEIKKKLEAHFRSLNKIPKGQVYKIPYKFNNFEINLCEKVIFNTDQTSDQNLSENGFTKIGGLEKEIKLIKSSVLHPLQRRDEMRKMFNDANKNEDVKIMSVGEIMWHLVKKAFVPNYRYQAPVKIEKSPKIKELEEIFKKYKTSQGVLLHGPPGCGKHGWTNRFYSS